MLIKEEGVKQSPEITPAEEIVVAEEVIPQDVKLEESPKVVEETTEQPATQEIKGSKTPEGHLYAALQEEKEHRRFLEEELKKVKESSISPEKVVVNDVPDFEYMTESEKWMAKELLQLKEKAKWEEDMSRARKQFPDLGDKEAEFKEYAYKFPKSVDIEVLAKSFLFDQKPEVKPVIEPTISAKGLEKPTGGSRQSPVPEMSLDDVKRLRETQPRLYEKMIMEGKIKKIPEK